MSAGALALNVALGFALLSLAASVAGPRWPRASAFASSTLLSSAAFAAIATWFLGRSLWAGDLQVRFVASHVTLALSPLWRLAALASEPSVAAMCAAVPSIAAAWWAAWRRAGKVRTAGAAAAAIAIMLLAGAAVAGPFAETGFFPGDGLGLAASLRDPLVVLSRAALAAAAAAGAMAAVRGARATGAPPGAAETMVPLLLLAALALAWEGEVRAGVVRSASPMGTWGGRGAAMFAASTSAFLLTSGERKLPRGGASLAPLALLGAPLALLLGRPGDRVGLVLALSTIALVLASAARQLADRPAGRANWPGRPPAATLLGGAFVTTLALVASPVASVEAIELAVGQEAVSRVGLVLTHQGVSRFEAGGDAHVVGVALGLRRGTGAEALVSPEQREFVNSRDETVDVVAPRPASAWFGTARALVWLEQVREGGGDAIGLEVRWRPFEALWPLAGLLLAGGLATAGLAAREQGAWCSTCGERPEPGARYCSRCGAAVV